MDATRLTSLLSHLVACRSTADQPAEIDRCFELIAKELVDLPLETENIVHNGVRSMIWKSSTPGPKVLLNAHLDVVPASDGMFTLRQEGNKLIGRGVTDMKYGIAVFIAVLQHLYAETKTLPPLDVMITSDEETGGQNGVGFLAKQITTPYDLVILPDAGDDWHIIEETKGALQLRAVATGISAHGSKPWEGDSAIDKLIKDLTVLRQHFPEQQQYSWDVTLNIGQIHGGQQVNQVSDSATADLDFRYPATVDGKKLLQQVRQLFKHSKLEILAQGSPLIIQRDHPHITRWKELISDKNQGDVFVKETGAVDGRYFAEQGMPVLLSKPIGGALHTEEEWLDLDSFVEFTHKLAEYLRGF
jgi:succinyl-diaminopimelate desuccinylase